MLSGPNNGTDRLLALAPMQDITTVSLWRLLKDYSCPDLFYTEYFRVHSVSHLDKDILKSVLDNDTGKPVIAQLVGNDIPGLIRSAKALQRYPVLGIDLNLGCPAPIVCSKNVGGALLKDLPRINTILSAMRQEISKPFTVKTRIGYHDTNSFAELLNIFNLNKIDLVSIHGRTVRSGYGGLVDWQMIDMAARTLKCPVLGNGDIHDAAFASRILQDIPLRGLMIGRGVLRNPWIFGQIRNQLAGKPIHCPVGREVLEYVHRLFEAMRPEGIKESIHVEMMKKYMNFIGAAADLSTPFLSEIRRVNNAADFFVVCRKFMEHDRPMDLVPPINKADHAPQRPMGSKEANSLLESCPPLQ